MKITQYEISDRQANRLLQISDYFKFSDPIRIRSEKFGSDLRINFAEITVKT